jgi:Tfp pilus assembly protein PilP
VRASRLAISLLIVGAAMATVVAQTPRPGSRPPATTSSAAAKPATATTGSAAASTTTNVQQTLQEILEEPTGADQYRYDPQGRRDPFQSLIGPRPPLPPGQRPPGVPGFLVDEMKLEGVVKTRQGFVGVVMGPDNKGYDVHVGDKALDGEVIRITPTSVVFRQEVNDPTRIERYKEVVKEITPEASKK